MWPLSVVHVAAIHLPHHTSPLQRRLHPSNSTSCHPPTLVVVLAGTFSFGGRRPRSLLLRRLRPHLAALVSMVSLALKLSLVSDPSSQAVYVQHYYSHHVSLQTNYEVG